MSRILKQAYKCNMPVYNRGKFHKGFVIGVRNVSETRSRMAKSKFEYVKSFELPDPCLPNCWIVVRVDGKGFSRFANVHGYVKPNDIRGIDLMNRAATSVMDEFRDICLAFGQSDEYSFVFRKDTNLYNRRASKLLTVVNSLFASSFVFYWSAFFGPIRLQYPPTFDGRVIIYPTDRNLKDYVSWRQADVHVNNLYNTAFWGLVIKKGLSNAQAEERLRGTLASDKNELLFSEFGMNYNNMPPVFRKGTALIRMLRKTGNGKLRQFVLPFHTDLINDLFWKEHPEILGLKSLQVYHTPSNDEKVPPPPEQTKETKSSTPATPETDSVSPEVKSSD